MQTLEVKRVKAAVGEVIEDGMVTTATHRIKQRPLIAVGVTFGVGIAMGTAIGLLASRRGRS